MAYVEPVGWMERLIVAMCAAEVPTDLGKVTIHLSGNQLFVTTSVGDTQLSLTCQGDDVTYVKECSREDLDPNMGRFSCAIINWQEGVDGTARRVLRHLADEARRRCVHGVMES
jgi:hypothetical protein